MKESHKVLNDLIDAVEELANLAEEMNPGATNQIIRIRFLLERAERCLAQAAAFESQ